MLSLITFWILVEPISGQDVDSSGTNREDETTIEQHELYIPISFTVSITPSLYSNPFDSNDIELLGIFNSPSGEQVVIPGFWMQPYEDRCQRPCELEDLQPKGQPIWQIRFTPQEVGMWSYTLQVRDNTAIVDTQQGDFEVVESNHNGFVRVGPNKRYFQFQNGDPYFPIGHNLNWSWDGAGGLITYLSWLEELHDAGGNYARLFIDVPWFIGLEWDAPAGDYRAAQADAARLDIILAAAADYNIELQLVLLWHQSLRSYTGVPVLIPENPPRPDTSMDWSNHSYSILNGGPMSGPAVFFLNEQAKELFRRRLRYVVARWGYSPQIFAWEIVDRIDRIGGYEPTAADIWLRDTASYLRQIDQQGHLITAGSLNYDPVIAGNPLLDFSESQFYQRRPIEETTDQVVGVLDVIRRNLQSSPTPTLLVDYSLNPWFEPIADDPQGIHFQNTLWASTLSGAGGGAISAWWDTYVIPQDLQQHYKVLNTFISGIDWPNLDFQPAEAGLLGENPAAYTSVRIDNFNRQFTAAPIEDIVHYITPDGVFPGIENVSSFLYGNLYNIRLRRAQSYRVALPIDTYLEVSTRAVSPQAGATLTIVIDEQSAVELDLNSDNASVRVRVPLAAGEHTITLDNIGDDWLELDYIEIGNLIAPARAITLRDSTSGVALAWLQHRDFTWDKVAAGVAVEPILFRYRLDKMPPGLYLVEVWNPVAGTALGEQLLTVGDDGVLSVELLPMDQELAIRMLLQKEVRMPENGETLPRVPKNSPNLGTQ